jgi:hypothetical protein
MTEKRVQINNIVKNQVPSYVREEFPLVIDFLSQYYIAQEFKGAPLDLIQNIDQYVKLDELTNTTDSIFLLNDISAIDTTITIDLIQSPRGTFNFPDSYGLLKIGNEIITYTGKTTNSFTGCIRGFSGITSYGSELTFSESDSSEHRSGDTIYNLSDLFLKQFLLKIKYQLTPGLENRELDSDLNQNLFIKQAKDFYSSKGTDLSFEILFKALYNEEVKVIRPKELLFRPSDAHYRITNDLVVERISGNPLDLENLTLFQKKYGEIEKAYSPVTSVSKLNTKTEGEFYKLKLDVGYNKDINYEGSVYGNFSVHPKTIAIGNVSTGSSTIDVDSTVGFPNSGEINVTYFDGSSGIVSYSSKSINQFLNCSNISSDISDNSVIGINTYAYATTGFGTEIRVRINSVLNSFDPNSSSYFYEKGDTLKIKSLGLDEKLVSTKDWFLNVSTTYKVSSISLIDSLNKIYSITLDKNHIFRIGNTFSITNNLNITETAKVIDVTSDRSIITKFNNIISTSNTNFVVTKNISKTNSSKFLNSNVFSTNVQNVYNDKEKTLVASTSLPSFNDISLDASDRSIIFSGTYVGDTFKITNLSDHGFYTGDAVYYTPNGTSLFDEGLYFIKRIDSNQVKFSRSRSDIDNSRFVSVSSQTTVTSNKITPYNLYSKYLDNQRIFREISPQQNDGNYYETFPGKTGILVNGVEILNYKSYDILYYGGIEEIEVTSNGSGYDVINPPRLLISDSVGSGATGFCAINGSLERIDIIDPGFDYQETPIVTITGGNGIGAKATVKTKLIDHRISFNSEIESQFVSLGSSQSTIGFSTYHKFRNGEPVVYKTDSQTAVGGLSTDAIYHVSVKTPYQIKLHKTKDDAISGINTIALTSYGTGNHNLESVNKKLVVDSINVINPGSGYQNKKRTCSISGINTSLDSINIKNHDFKSGEIVKYYNEGTSISGLTTNTEYYVTKIDNDNFRLSNTFINLDEKDFYYRTKQYVDLKSVGSGSHIFNYPEIEVSLLGNVGISSTNGVTFKAQIRPIFRGEITSVHVDSNGSNYGSLETLNYQRQPNIDILNGTNAELIPIISNGQITEVLVSNVGKNYFSTPDLLITGDGSGATLTPIIENGQITSIKIIQGGSGYNSNSTTISVSPSGLFFSAKAKIKTWTVNLFQKYINNITSDDGFLTDSSNPKFGIQYCHLYAPRKLREIVYALDQSGKVIYSKKDLRKSNNLELTSSDHSPIIGWAYDGNPIYGPYGYSTSQGGSVSQMKSGYKIDIKSNRPPLSIFPAGFFIEDYTHYEVNDDTVLDENNGRFCITPDFPNGTYAYFATINDGNADSSGSFSGYKRPVFPFIIGNSFKSKPNQFNFDPDSNQNDLNLNDTNWKRNTYYYNLSSGNQYYKYVNLPNNLDQTIDIKSTYTGEVEKIGISTGGDNYRVNDQLVFDNLDASGKQRGFGVSAKVVKIGGKSINSISVATTTIYNAEFYPGAEKDSYNIYSNTPHNLKNTDIINVSGLNTTSSLLEGSFSAGISSNALFLVGIGTSTIGLHTVSTTGIVTYISVRGNLSDQYIRENDILQIDSEKIKVLNVDRESSRLRILRQIDGTIGVSHSTSSVIYENPRKITISVGFKSEYSYRVNKELYFNPKEAIGLGTVSGVGIGTTLNISNPGAGLTQIFIPTKTIYLPNHGLLTGDELTYLSNGGSVIAVSTNGISTSLTLSDSSTVYVAKISNDLIGISTVRVGLGSTGTFVGIASNQNFESTLYFVGIGTGVYHSFKTNFNSITGEISRNIVTVSTAQTHGLKNDDYVDINVNVGSVTTITVKYNDYNRVLLINPQSFSASGVNTSTNSIVISSHGFKTGQKVIHTSTSPCGGLNDNGEYYVVVFDPNTIKLSPTYYDSVKLKPSIVGISSTSFGEISLVNPAINLYKNSIVDFDLSHSSLSYTYQSTKYSAFDFNFYKNSNFTEIFETTRNSRVFDVQKVGSIGISTNAKVVLTMSDELPEKLYYKLTPVYDGNIPKEKSEIVVDDTVISSSELLFNNSGYNGNKKVSIASTTSFTYTLSKIPEKQSYVGEDANITYQTDSENALGPIAQVKILNKGFSYSSLPGITTVSSLLGIGAILETDSKSIGRIKNSKINDIGFNYPSDYTLRPVTSLPQVIKVEPLSSFLSIGISSFGKGYSVSPKILVFDGKTGNIIPEVDLRYEVGDSFVSIIKNTYGISDVVPRLLPTQNSNGVGISTISFNPVTKDVTVKLSVGFSTSDSFPFKVNDRVLIENISVGVGSTGKGYNSENYNYSLFTLTSVDENRGGIGSVTYNLSQFLNGSEFPGTFNSTNSSGRIIPEKDFPIFEIKLTKNDYLKNENVFSNSVSSGVVENWDPKNNYLKVISNQRFVVGEIIEGSSSSTQGIASSITYFDSSIKLGAFSKVENGWENDAGTLNNSLQRIQDNFYYQNFSYSLKSRVDYDTWNDPVSTLNHTAGFKKFSDYQLESLSSIPMNIGITTATTSVDVVTDIIGVIDLNCVYDFDLASENSLRISSRLFSDEIRFANRILSDYLESVGNRVLSIDDLSGQFNSNPRPTRYSEVFRFDLNDIRSQKYIVYIKDKRYYNQRQLMLVTLVNDNFNGYINQYARLESAYDLGSFDFSISGNQGILNFYPVNYSINDYDLSFISYNLNDNLLGVGSTSIGSSLISTASTVVSSGSTTTIVSLDSSYSGVKILVNISGVNNEFEFDEINLINNGSDVEFVEYGQLTTNLGPYSISGFGTYYPYISGSNLNVDFIPNVGTALTVNTVQISLGNTESTGIGTFDMKHARIESRTTSIASSTSPISHIIGEYPDAYDVAYFIVQVFDLTNNESQISEVVVIDDDTETYSVEYGNVETSSGIGTIGTQRTGSITELLFTPIENIDVQVKVFMNSLRHENDDLDIVDFMNATIQTAYANYTGTDTDVKRAFNLNHKNFPIFERYFDGSSSNTVDTINNTILIPNHFFVSGEKIKYYHAGAGTTQAIGIASTYFGVGIGTTDKLPSEIYAIKVNESLIKLASSAENALKSIPETLNITSVGIGTSHRFVATNQNPKVIVAIDNVIQSPIVSTALTSTLSKSSTTIDDVLYFSGITSFFGGDLIKIGSEIMRIESVGFGTTNGIKVRRPWLGTVNVGYSTGSLVTKVVGNYNIVDNVLNFVTAPYGNLPFSSVTNSPDERDWTGISTGSSFQGRVFLRSGIINTSNETYHKNYIFDDISGQFTGSKNTFTLKSSSSNVTGITTENAIILINDIFQGPGLKNQYVLQESSGITSIRFTGTATSVSYDINTSSLPSGGIIVSVGSTEGFGYQPLISAGATAIVSTSGTITSISVGNTGSGYRAPTSYEISVNTSHPIGIGSTIIYLQNNNSLFSLLNLLNTGSNCSIGIGTFIGIGSVITSIGSTFVYVGTSATSSYTIPSGTQATVKISNPQIGFANVGVANSSVGICTVTHVGYSTIISGNISKTVTITNSGYGYTSSNPPLVVIDDPLSYTNIPLIYSSSSSGLGTEATIDIVVGQGSSVIDFEINNTGYGYGEGQVLTIPTGGLTGIPTTSSLSEFQISIQKVFNDRFTGWSIGELQIIDSIEDLFDGEEFVFPLKVSDNLVSIRSSKGSNINVQDTLLVFVNDILQVPGEGYIFEGGSLITFTEPPKQDDTCIILFYKGSGSVDVSETDILETVKVGDELTLGYDSYLNQPSSWQEDFRTVTKINSTDFVTTNPYFGPGNIDNEDVFRPIIWCRQSEDKIIDGKEIGKDRVLYEPLINPYAYLIQPVGVGSTIIYVDNIRPFFNPINENDSTLSFQNNITFLSQESKVSASATAIVSSAGTITSISISDGGNGYVSAPSVTIQNPVGLGTTQRATASSSITSGIVTFVSITGPGTGYATTNPPLVLIEPPAFISEKNSVSSYEGDSGIIVGISTTSVGVAYTGLILDLYIPQNSFLRDSRITGVTTLSGIQNEYYFTVYKSNIGYGLTSLNSSGGVVGVGTSFFDNVYQAINVSFAQTSITGIGLTYITKVLISVSGYNGLVATGLGSYFGEYSWGRITLNSRSESVNYNSYNTSGVSGISSGTIVKRTNSLKYSNYT